MARFKAIAYTTRRWRVAGLAWQLASGLAKHPARLKRHLHAGVSTILDEQFQASSPLPLLEDNLWGRIMRYDVIMPPMSMKIPGNQSVKGLLFLLSLAQAIHAKCIFEIGTFNGLTARALAQNVPDATVHTLDIPHEVATALALEQSDHSLRVRFPRLAYEQNPVAARVVQHWGDSATFDFSPWLQKCDLVYIDGSHSASYVASDTSQALRMLSAGGVIVWDDYWWRVAGVRAVLDTLSHLDLRRIPETRLVVHLGPAAKARLLSHEETVVAEGRP